MSYAKFGQAIKTGKDAERNWWAVRQCAPHNACCWPQPDLGRSGFLSVRFRGFCLAPISRP